MNKVILMGRLTRDPDIRISAGEKGMAVGRYTLAVDRKYKREGEATADFISCICFDKKAEFAEKYFRQGTPYSRKRQDPDRKLREPGRKKGIYDGCHCRGSGVCRGKTCAGGAAAGRRAGTCGWPSGHPG